MDTTNIFLALANHRWKNGEDGETIAVECAVVLDWLITEGTGIKNNDEELQRLMTLARQQQ